MKTVLGYIKIFYREHCSIWELIIGLLYVAGFTYLNYATPIIKDWKMGVLREPGILTFHFVIYSVPLLFGYLVQSLLYKKWEIWKNPKFWGLVLFALLVFTFRSGNHLLDPIIWGGLKFREMALWRYSVVMSVVTNAMVFVPIFVYYFFFEKNKENFYGFTFKGFDTKPYFMMLLIMLPLIILASTQGDFLGTYPRGARFSDLDVNNPAHRIYYFIYELFYGSAFFGVEFFFRGFMVMAFTAVVGPRAIVPMALFYMTIHYGKPAGELISSFFGGSLLGIIAFYSRSIIGGIIVHVGIAWLMEIGAYVGNYFNS